MQSNEENAKTVFEQKQKIRDRYKGVDEGQLDVILAKPQEDFYDESKSKRVAVYARVSTDDPRQTSSYELQKNHYTDMVNKRPDWDLMGIYADEGISGTSLQHRDSFIRMIKDCEEGKIDLIVTKSVSRFARNVVDCIGYVRQLKSMNPPIGIFFETENIFTLNPNSEMTLGFMSTMAQEESHNKSEVMNASIEMRFKRGIFLTPALLGYDLDEDGNLVINEEEAKVVRLIFFLYLYGYSSQEVAEELTKLNCRTKKGNTQWSSTTVLGVLQNERHCGDVLARKTFTPDYLNHKKKKNRRDRNQYRQFDHHESIVSRDDFIAVQHKIMNSKYGTQQFLPSLNVMKGGLLKGFVLINTKWAAFSASDYVSASNSARDKEYDSKETAGEHMPNEGDFDLRGFEITRAQFINTNNSISVRFSTDGIDFSMEAIKKFPNRLFVQLYIDPVEKLFAVKPCKKDEAYQVQWARTKNGKLINKTIAVSAFVPTLYKIMDWNLDCKYKCIGNLKSIKDQNAAIIFNLSDFEVSMPRNVIDNEDDRINPLTPSNSRNIIAFPAEWSDSFGTSVYDHPYTNDSILLNDESKKIDSEKLKYKTDDLNVTEPEIVNKEIKELTQHFKEENSGGAE